MIVNCNITICKNIKKLTKFKICYVYKKFIL